jgi:hypothetical protein
MELRNQTTGTVITDRQFRDSNPQVSFPRVLTPEILAEYGYDPILEGPQATVTAPYETSVRSGIEEVNGQWFTKYVVGPTFTDTDDATAAEQEATYRARIDSEAADRVRAQRDKLLRDTDWSVIYEQEASSRQARSPAYDKPINTYRQALRDITNQPGFPHTITWPDKP